MAGRIESSIVQELLLLGPGTSESFTQTKSCDNREIPLKEDDNDSSLTPGSVDAPHDVAAAKSLTTTAILFYLGRGVPLDFVYKALLP